MTPLASFFRARDDRSPAPVASGVTRRVVMNAIVSSAALVAATPAVAAPLSDPSVTAHDPVFGLAERFLEAERACLEAYDAYDEFEPMDQWRARNPAPTSAQKEALGKWNRRRQAAERRTGYRELERANNEAQRRYFEAETALCDAIPLTWDGLAVKAQAFLSTHAEGERRLMRALMLDIAVLSGALDRTKARPLDGVETITESQLLKDLLDRSVRQEIVNEVINDLAAAAEV
jgi:hypothetical protein